MYLYIFDYCTDEINEINLGDENRDIDVEATLLKQGMDIDTAAYMYSPDKLSIKELVGAEIVYNDNDEDGKERKTI